MLQETIYCYREILGVDFPTLSYTVEPVYWLQQPPLGQKKVGILKRWYIREVKTRVNVWAVLQKKWLS